MQGLALHFGFYSKCKRKTLGDFQEGCDLICFMFLKDHSGRWVILDWIIGYARMKAILEVSAVVTGSKVVVGEMLRSGPIQDVFCK